MCGIFGYTGKDPKKVNVDKLNILGIMNETRGVDSCGITMDGNILKGVDHLATYRDFVTYYDIGKPNISPVVIGHTRKSTVGAHTLANAHPFGFGSLTIKGAKKEGFKFVGVHNGTLLNHKEFAATRKLKITKDVTVKVKGKDNNNKEIFINEKRTVNKIDSELLLEALYSDGNFKVLSEYNGAVATMFCNLTNPNIMYAYHGKSARQEGSEVIEEERPLYYWQESPNSAYISSIEDSLYAIGGDSDTIGEFEHNTVYEIKDGNIKKAKKYIISRTKNWQKAGGYASSNFQTRRPGFQNSTKQNSNVGTSFTRPQPGTDSYCRGGLASKNFYPKIGTVEQLQLNLELPIDKGLLAETFDKDPNIAKGATMFKNLRYWRNGHKADGVFGFVEGYGFYYLGNTRAQAIKNLVKSWSGRPFYKGAFITDKKITDLPNDAFIPFNSTLVKKNPDTFLHFMFEGIRYKQAIDWQSIKDDSLRARKFGIIELSIPAAHPIIDLETGSSRKHGAYFKGELANGEFGILGAEKKYKFNSGQIKNISYIEGNIPDVLQKNNTKLYSLSTAESFLNNFLKDSESKVIQLGASTPIKNNTKNFNNAIDDLKKEEEAEEREIDLLISENFNENFENFPVAMKKLQKYRKHSKKAETAFCILQVFMHSCNALIKIDMEKNKK